MNGIRREGSGYSILIASVLALGAVLGAVTFLPTNARGATLYVGGGGPGNFTTIQAAVDAANPGDTVFVYAGVYAERITVPKTLNLVGEDRETTVVDGGRVAGDVVRVTASWVNLTGFTVTRGTGDEAAAAIEFAFVQHGRIEGNLVVDNWGSGINLVSSTNITIANNTLVDNTHPDGGALYLISSDENRIVNNSATGSADGVTLVSSHRNVVAGNNFTTNWDYGVSMSLSDENLIEDNLFFDNWGRGVRAGGSDRNMIRNNTLIENYAGIQLYAGARNNTVAGNRFNNTWWYGVELDASTGNRVTGNTFASTYGDGVSVQYATGETVDNNTFQGSLYADVDLDTSVGISVANNRMTRGLLVSYPSFGVVELRYWNTHDIPPTNLVDDHPVYYWRNVTGGVVPAGAGQVILANATGVVVENQTFGRAVVGIEAGFSTGALVSNVSGRGNLYGILLNASTDFLIQNASFDNATWYGISVEGSDSNTIRNASFAGAEYAAVGLKTSFQNRIVSANMSRGTAYGLLFENSDTNVVSESVFAENARAGIVLRNSDLNSVFRSTLANNTRGGVALTTSDDNMILENTIAENAGAGVNLTNSVGNRIYHNNFAGNTPQAVDDRANAWDDGYPSGGNYWSDYGGSDAYRGPNQDIPGSDGIGDDPYVIDADSVDAYPLIAPYQAGGRPPGPPHVRSARLAGPGLADVMLTWDLSGDDGGGEGDVAGYEVWIGTAYDASGASYTRLGSVPAGTTSYVHAGGGFGDPATYFYQVRAFEAGAGRTTPSPEQGAKGAGALPDGWLLFSIPLVQADASVAAVLQTLTFDAVRTYRAADPADPWKSYRPGSAGDLDSLAWGDGLWVHVTAPGVLAIAGLVVPAPAFLLRPGWNLVAYASPVSESMAASLADVPGVLRVETYDPLSGDPYGLRTVDPAEMLLPAWAYWIYVEGPGGVWVQG